MSSASRRPRRHVVYQRPLENPGTAEGFTQILCPCPRNRRGSGIGTRCQYGDAGRRHRKDEAWKRETIAAVLEETMGRKKPEPLEFNIKAFNAGCEAAGKGE